MTLFSYVVRWDHGFAPNPFYNVCTLATCKPAIRKKARLGDWVLGTGGSGRNFSGRAIFFMRVTDITTFDKYWTHERYQIKRPVMNGSLKQRFGDNIYHRNEKGVWLQADSRHSEIGGSNKQNLDNDTGTTDRVLIGTEYTYWGEKAPVIPKAFSKFVLRRPGMDDRFDETEVGELLAWLKSFDEAGQVGKPLEWQYRRRWR